MLLPIVIIMVRLSPCIGRLILNMRIMGGGVIEIKQLA